MIYIVWYSTTNAEENGIIRAFYDHKTAIQFADAEELKRASEGLGHLIWVDAVEVE
jgi:IS30 family transposase